MKSYPLRLFGPVPIFFCVLLIAAAPYVIFGKDAVFLVHDHLDANVAWASVLAAEGKLFSPASEIVQGILGGVERRYLVPPGMVYYWLFALFEPFHAIVAAELITRSIAFIGLYALINDFALDPDSDHAASRLLTGAVAAWFALLPFWPPGAGSVAGVPLFFWAAFSFRRDGLRGGPTFAVVIASAVFVFYGSLITSGFFALVLTSVVIARDVLFGNRLQAVRLVLFNFCVSAMFLLQNINLLGVMSSGVPTSRSEVVVPVAETYDFWNVMLGSLLHGQYHAQTVLDWPVFAAIGTAMFILIVARFRAPAIFKSLWRLRMVLTLALLALIFTGFMYALHGLPAVQDTVGAQGLWGFNFSRFHWLQPALWAVVFGCALQIVAKVAHLPWVQHREGSARAPSRPAPVRGLMRLAPLLPFALAFLQILGTINHLHAYQGPDAPRHATYNAFYDPELFGRIKSELGGGGDPARYGMIGLHPAIAQVNGMKTVGGYLGVYPLSVKHAFRKIIAEELRKDLRLAAYFDEWGSRAYLFALDLNDCRFMCWAGVAPDSIEVALDTRALRDFGGTHVISVSRLENAETLGLDLVGEYRSSYALSRHWRLFAYKIE